MGVVRYVGVVGFCWWFLAVLLHSEKQKPGIVRGYYPQDHVWDLGLGLGGVVMCFLFGLFSLGEMVYTP